MNEQKKTVPAGISDLFALILTYIFTFSLIKRVIEGPQFMITASYLLIFALASGYIISKRKHFELNALPAGIIAVVSSLTFSLHTDSVNYLILLMLIYLSGSYCISLTKSARHSRGSYFYLLDVLKCEVGIPISKIFLALRSTFAGQRKKDAAHKKQHKGTVTVLIGFLCAVPVLCIVIPLLLSGDAAFESVVGSFADKVSNWFDLFVYDKIGESFTEFFLFGVPTLIFAPYIFSVMFSFRHGVTDESNQDTSKGYEKFRFAPTALLAGFLGVISLVYAIYLLSQTAYFFSAFAGHLPGGVSITVTEYARRGFFEMAKIAGVNFAVIAVSVLFGKRTDGKISPVVKYFNVFLCAFTLVLISTSISKILLYIAEMGLTRKRIFVFAFDIVLVCVFLAVIIRLFKENFPYMRVITAAACVVLTVLGLMGVDNVIAEYNTKMYLSGKLNTVDVDLIYDYSDDLSKVRMESLLTLTKCEDRKTAVKAKNCLISIFGEDYNQSLNHNGKFAFDTLDDVTTYNFIRQHTDELSPYFEAIGMVFVNLNTSKTITEITLTCNDGMKGKFDKSSYFYTDERGFEKYATHILHLPSIGLQNISLTDADGNVYTFEETRGCVEIYDTADGALMIKGVWEEE